MRIALLSQPWARAWPPADSIAIWNAEVGRRLAERGHDVAIWGPELGSAHADTAAPVDVREVSIRGDWRVQRLLAPVARVRPADRPLFASPLYHAEYAARAAVGMRRFGADVVHVHNFTQWVPPLARANPGARAVLHMHCDWLSTLHRPTMLRRARRAGAIIGAAEHITARTRASLPELAGRCATVPNGVDPAAFAGAAREPGPGPRIIAIGRISPEKGTHRLLEAFTRIVAACPEAELELLGAEAPVPREMLIALEDDAVVRDLSRFPEHGYLERSREALSPEGAARLRLTGAVPHADVAAHLARADVLVAASLSEAFGMPVIEAMAAGVPVVATAVGGMREIVTHGVDGLLVPRDDAEALAAAVIALARDPELRARLAAAGRRTAAERYSWDAVTTQVLALYPAAR